MKKTLYARLLFPGLFLVLPFLTYAQDGDKEESKFYEELIRAPIVPQRDTGVIQSDLVSTQKQIQQAEKAITDAQAKVKEADSWIATQKKEIDNLKSKINTAKKEKRESDRLMLEAQKKQLELVADYLQKSKDLRSGELDLAKSQKDLLNSEAKVYGAELELRSKADALKNASLSDPNLINLALEATKASESTLMLMKTMAEKNAAVSGRMTKIADRRVELVQTRNKLITEDRVRNAIERRKGTPDAP